jgi:hypothetical protein
MYKKLGPAGPLEREGSPILITYTNFAALADIIWI